VFLEEKVDVVILEVGVGGRLDATNCIPKPIVCGVTSLGFDHVELLGHTLPVCCSALSWSVRLRHQETLHQNQTLARFACNVTPERCCPCMLPAALAHYAVPATLPATLGYYVVLVLHACWVCCQT